MAADTHYGYCDDCTERWEERDVVLLASCPTCGSSDFSRSDEPPGAGRDPFGRPDPRTHPEAWSE